MYDYGAAEWLLIFYIYGFCGWVFESVVVSLQQRRLVNRGFLRGPLLPIYGFGAAIMLHVSLPLAGQPVPLFFTGMAVATVFEYAVGVAMEAVFKVKYWDYSEHRFQFQGRICLQSSVAWGVLSLALPVMHQPVERLLAQFAPRPALFTALAISVYFLSDVAASVTSALDLARMLEELDKMRESVNSLRTQLSEAALEKKEQLSAAAAETREALTTAANETRAAAEKTRVQLHLAIQDAQDQINAKIQGMKWTRKWLVRGNPDLRSARFDEALRELKEYLNRR